jgi:heat induced stress protein YflT
MAQLQGNTNGTSATTRRVVASYSTYRDAERAVDYLSDNGFPVERTAIVGNGLRLVEQVTGRMGYGMAALRGALAGGFVGLLIGWLFALFNWLDPVVASGWLIVDGLWFGAVAGGVLGVLQHALAQGRRDFASVPMMQADRYDVLVDEEVAQDAARLLARMGQAAASAEAS